MKYINHLSEEVTLKFSRGSEIDGLSYYPDEEPIAIRIIKSGWENQYHVLVEFGDFEQTDYYHLTAEQILEKFGIPELP